jgi:hypothetical protein
MSQKGMPTCPNQIQGSRESYLGTQGFVQSGCYGKLMTQF